MKKKRLGLHTFPSKSTMMSGRSSFCVSLTFWNDIRSTVWLFVCAFSRTQITKLEVNFERLLSRCQEYVYRYATKRSSVDFANLSEIASPRGAFVSASTRYCLCEILARESTLLIFSAPSHACDMTRRYFHGLYDPALDHCVFLDSSFQLDR